MSYVEHWQRACDRRVAQAIGELCFEGLVHARSLGAGAYAIDLAEGVQWRVRARPSAWGGLHVEPGTAERRVGEGPLERIDSPAQLVLDARRELGATPKVLAEWLEEIHASVLAEAEQCSRLSTWTAERLADLDALELEQRLDGHPKLIAHRGRIGWGLDDLACHAPEFGGRVRLHWLVVAPEHARCSGLADDRDRRLLDESCDPCERARLLDTLHARAPGLAETGVLVPVHPWQWQRHVAAQYGRLIGRGAMVSLGRFGDRHAPRLSIRTLANLDRPERADLKLALSILVTSCWRGLPGEHVEQGVGIGAALRGRVEADPLLREAGVRVLVDRGGVHVPQPEFERLEGSPYRLREIVGAIWRESARSRLRPGELEVPAAALHQTDLAGVPLLRTWVDRSGVSIERWLQALFEHSAVPLWHLQVGHGLGVIAHGQNLGLILREGLPVGMLLRDVHGDVRRDREREFEGALAGLRALPPEQLVHDLYTGYFVSVLRFVAPLVERGFGLPERELLRILVGALQRHSERVRDPEAYARFDLLRPQMVRICLNRARLRAGHGEGESRSLPELGPPLRNPLAHLEDLHEDE
ncbi:IucA/IucC family protein [Nannocystaceae bacterium ST9]